MKPSLQHEIEEAERAVIRRDERLLDRLIVASQLASQTAERSRGVVRGAAIGIGVLALLGLLRQRRRAQMAPPPTVVEMPRTARQSFWATLPWLLPLLLPGRAPPVVRGPLWLRLGRLAASFIDRWQAQQRRRAVHR